VGRALDRWAALTNAYQNDPSLHDRLLNVFVRAYDVVDRDYWPARVAAAEFFLSHDNDQGAMQELAAASKLARGDARVAELLGLVSLSHFNFDAADGAVVAMRRVNRDDVRAELL